jgi:hypothetical protein
MTSASGRLEHAMLKIQNFKDSFPELKLYEIEKRPTIKFTENISGCFWIDEMQSAINHEFKIRSIQASSVRPEAPKGFAA